ncbi:MAG TPA: NHLP leader peptide family natural product precursor [Verrucomicrobiae bacterium]|nr:NHLP leader peptide family natural product precursor [Verrucomicrobiae bacterium]
MHPTDPHWQETLRAIFRRAATDEAFRQRCLSDPSGVVRDITGVEPPPGIKFRFVEKPVETLFILPPFRASDGDLSDGDLGDVAGGAGGGATGCANFSGRHTCNHAETTLS